MDTLQQLDSLDSKVKKLVAEVLQLRQAKDVLLSENEKLKQAFAKNEDLVVDLKRQLEKTQHALEKKHENAPEQVVSLKYKIDSYIEEIDKCIEWLENT
jgi:predicted  nucleic acid-binding Zn-ribbon protein